jgi:hypothetical protein
MKLTASLFATALLLAPTIFAQDRLSVDKAPQVNPEPAEPAEVPLIPQEVAPVEKPRGRAIEQKSTTIKRTKTDESTEELNQRIRFREARTKALREASVQAEWEKSLQARTDLEKREALKRHYQLLFARMTKIDGSLKKLIDERKLLALRRLEQTRIASTEPLDPAERNARFERTQ